MGPDVTALPSAHPATWRYTRWPMRTCVRVLLGDKPPTPLGRCGYVGSITALRQISANCSKPSHSQEEWGEIGVDRETAIRFVLGARISPPRTLPHQGGGRGHRWRIDGAQYLGIYACINLSRMSPSSALAIMG